MLALLLGQFPNSLIGEKKGRSKRKCGVNPGFGWWNVKRQLLFIVDKINHSTDATTTSVYSHFNDWLTLAVPFIVDIVVNVSSATEGKDF